MGEIRLFRTETGSATLLNGGLVPLEKQLQKLIEQHLQELLGVRFLATEYSTGKKHAGRIDTLGIDENGCPVIIEYKRSKGESVINQGLFYLDWLLDHRGEFQLLVQSTLGPDASDTIEWNAPRLLCVAGEFTRYDEHAVHQINRNIELIRYRRYGEELLLLELVNSSIASSTAKSEPNTATATDLQETNAGDRLTAQASLDKLDGEMTELYAELRSFLLELGDDVQERTLKHYIAFKRLRNFASVQVFHKARSLAVYLHVDPETVALEEGFLRDVRKIGHMGTGALEVSIDSPDSLNRAKPLLLRSYEGT